MEKGGLVSANEAVELRKDVVSGGGLLGGEFSRLFDEQAAARSRPGAEVTAGQVRQEMLDFLAVQIGAQAGSNYG